MKNRKWLLIVSLVLALTMSLGGTLAYLTDTDEAVNVMTIGNVKIEQHEMKRKEGILYNAELKAGDLIEFEQDQPLYPAYPVTGQPSDYTAGLTNAEGIKWGPYVYTGTAWNGLWDDSKLVGAIDKFVFVENTGEADAYFRTIIAYECPEGVKIGEPTDGAHIMLNVNGSDLFVDKFVDYIMVDGTRYAMYEFVYTPALKAGQWAHPSLLQVVMTHNATNKTVELLGENYEILVVTQAVQVNNLKTLGAAGALDMAFGKVSATSHPWLDWNGVEEGDQDPDNWTIVETVDELNDALVNGGNIILTNDISIGKLDLTQITNDVTINANGKKITTTDYYGIEVTRDKNVTITNAEIVMNKPGDYINYAAGLKIANADYQGATIKLENCKITMANDDWAYAVTMPASVKNLNLVIDNCELEGAVALQCWGDNNTITITNSKLICNYKTSELYTSYCVALQGDGTYNSENNKLVIDGCEFAYSGIDNFNSTIYSVGNYGINNTINVTNCTYGEKICTTVVTE